MIAYMVSLVTLNASTKSEDFWNKLFATPRFRNGFVFYSLPFFVVAAVLIAIGRWTPDRTECVIWRRVILGLCVLTLVLAGLLMNMFGSGFDFKLSG